MNIGRLLKWSVYLLGAACFIGFLYMTDDMPPRAHVIINRGVNLP